MRRVSLADKLHNARSLVADYYSQKQATWNKFKGGREGTLWYYRSIIEAARQAGECGFLLEELETVVQYLENCA